MDGTITTPANGTSPVTNIFKPSDTMSPVLPYLTGNSGFGGAGAAGLGAGALGFLAGSMIGGRGGLFGNNGDGAQAMADISITRDLGEIKKDVMLAESMTQNAIQSNASGTNSLLMQQTVDLIQQGFESQLANMQGFNAGQVTTLVGNSGIKDNIGQVAAAMVGATNTAAMQTQQGFFNTQVAISNDGEKTRALIARQYEDTLNRELTDAKNKITELLGDGRRSADNTGIRIDMINNQNQNQMQFQQQQQVLGTLASIVADVSQVARATNQNLIIGNSGSSTVGAQTSNPVNVRT